MAYILALIALESTILFLLLLSLSLLIYQSVTLINCIKTLNISGSKVAAKNYEILNFADFNFTLALMLMKNKEKRIISDN